MAYNPLGSRPGGVGYDPNQENRELGSRPGMVGSDTNNPWTFGEKIADAFSGIKDRFGFGTDVPQTKTFDPSDKGQVGDMQAFLNKEGYRDSEGNKLEPDSMFGPKTQYAYRSYVNDQRIEQGLEPYVWEQPKSEEPVGVLNPDFEAGGPPNMIDGQYNYNPDVRASDVNTQYTGPQPVPNLDAEQTEAPSFWNMLLSQPGRFIDQFKK